MTRLKVGKGCRAADMALLNRMAPMMTSKTDEALTDVFRISYNTWKKLDAGQPVRSSVLDRLEERVAFLESRGRAQL